ncbi:unnamed protein product [Chrysoparadoxa australica]
MASSEELWSLLQAKVKEDREALTKRVKASFRFIIHESSGKVTHILNLKEEGGWISEGDDEASVDATIEMKAEHFALLCLGKMSPQQAFMAGKLKIKGDIRASMRLMPLITRLDAKTSKL